MTFVVEQEDVGIEIVATRHLGALSLPMRQVRRFSTGKAERQYFCQCACGKGRWLGRSNVRIRMRSLRCQSCQSRETAKHCLNYPGRERPTGRACPAYRRGYTLSQGYKIVHLPQNHPFRAMADCNGRCRQHRLVMAMALGRLLKPWEIVHHKNRNRGDNRRRNLVLLTGVVHRLVTSMEQHIEKLERRVQQLQAENERLKNASDSA